MMSYYICNVSKVISGRQASKELAFDEKVPMRVKSSQ